MRITVTLEVESRAILAALRRGATPSFLGYRVIDCHNGPTPAPAGLSGNTTEDYRNAPSSIGPLAATWKDKPHRLVYDLCREVEHLSTGHKRKSR